MNKHKFRIVLFFFFITLLSGVFRVNVMYHRANMSEADRAVYNNSTGQEQDNRRVDLYGEILLRKNQGKKLKIYYTAAPFDIRLDTGSHIMYINGQAYKNVVAEKNKIINKFMDIINNGIKGMKKHSNRGVDCFKHMVSGRKNVEDTSY
jgi:hypothetical protein